MILSSHSREESGSASPICDILIPSFSSGIDSSFLPHLQHPSFVEIIDLSLDPVSSRPIKNKRLTHELEQLPS